MGRSCRTDTIAPTGDDEGATVRFAIKTLPEHTTWQEMLDVWVAADEIELFESAWHWDHFYPLTGDMAGPNLEAWTTLTAAAQATRRIRVGCQVLGMIYRHPAVLANMAATLDIVSGGRLELGLGAYGIELPPLRERFDRFDEGVQAIIALLTEPTATFPGRYVRLTEARCEPKPVQRPHPPIVIGGRGPKRTLRATARWAQGWHCLTSSPQDWLDVKQTLIEHCMDIGRDPGEIDCSVNIRLKDSPDNGGLAGGVRVVAEEAAAYRDAGVDLAVVTLPLRAKPAILEPVAEALAPLA
jgi:alkanesulfonate monooxygenase SsuD/methylene tetrahydromethanopterin reductase-like flavin-dependent oxidoreductase (luciferase family)